MDKTKETHDRSFLDKCWKDKHGKQTFWQFPNWPLTFWAIFTFIAISVNGTMAHLSSFIAFIALVVWSLLEIFKGDSYFRKGLGAVVLIASLINRFR